jgi:hypothetical protein
MMTVGAGPAGEEREAVKQAKRDEASAAKRGEAELSRRDKRRLGEHPRPGETWGEAPHGRVSAVRGKLADLLCSLNAG